jgi:hypothetical protein
MHVSAFFAARTVTSWVGTPVVRKPLAAVQAATASCSNYHCRHVGHIHYLTLKDPPSSSTNPHGGSPPTSAPSRFPTTSALPQALPQLPSSFPTTSSSGTPTAATAPSCFPNVFFRHSHSRGYIGRSPKLYLRYGIRAAET